MTCAIHQPQYYPWLGYFDKIAKVKSYLIMDDVQFVPRSLECRNNFIDAKGLPRILTVSVEKKDVREKKIRDVKVFDCAKWQKQHLGFLETAFRYSKYRGEVMDAIHPIFEKDYVFLQDVLMDTIFAIMRMLDINVPVSLQSELEYPKTDPALDGHARRGQDVLNLCLGMGASRYITGTGGSLQFLNPQSFKNAHIELLIQNYTCPRYAQAHTEAFIPNISALDAFFSCGIENTKRLFHENIAPDFPYDEYMRMHPLLKQAPPRKLNRIHPLYGMARRVCLNTSPQKCHILFLRSRIHFLFFYSVSRSAGAMGWQS